MRSRIFPILLVIAWLSPAAADASEPWGIRLSYVTPDATTTAGVAWNTDSADAESIVEYGPTTAYGQTVTGTATNRGSTLGTVHEVNLTGLTPNTVYHYRVGGPGAWSQDFAFRTAHADQCTPFTVVAMGDDRSDDDSGPSPRWNPILKESLTTNPLMLLNTGDLVREGKEAKQWANWMRASDPHLATTAHLPTMGNHDDGPGEGDGALYNQLFHLPRNEVTGTEDYYYVTAGNLIVVSLSTMEFMGGTRPFSDQAAWLDKVLTENPRMWKIVFFHHPIHTSVAGIFGKDLSHPPDEQGQNAALIPVFDKHHVDFVFYGHNHWYERFRPMRNGTVAENPKEGTWYAVTGGAGAMTYGLLNAIKLFCPGAEGSSVCAGDHHYVELAFDGNVATYTARATATQLLTTDEGNRKVLDKFIVTKPWPNGENPCEVGPVDPDPGPEPVPDTAAPDAAVTPDVPGPADPGTPDDPGAATDPGTTVDRGVEQDPGVAADPGKAADTAGPTPDPGVPVASGGKSGGHCAAGALDASPAGAVVTFLFLLALIARRRSARS